MGTVPEGQSPKYSSWPAAEPSRRHAIFQFVGGRLRRWVQIHSVDRPVSYLAAKVRIGRVESLADAFLFVLLRFLGGFLFLCRHGRLFLGLFFAVLSFTHHFFSCFELHERAVYFRRIDYTTQHNPA